MRGIFLGLAVCLLCSTSLNAQDCGRHMPNKIRFKVIKPVSVVKSTVTFTTETGMRVLCSAKKVIAAPFKDVEFNTFEYTFPKLKWEGGIFKRIPQPPTEEELKEYLFPLHIEDPRDKVII